MRSGLAYKEVNLIYNKINSNKLKEKNKGALHSEPEITESRLFISILIRTFSC